jgi:beta-1,4-mannosyltransferase
MVSSFPRRCWWEPPCLLVLIPLFTLWEVVGVLRGVVRFLSQGDHTFTVIAKPR